MYKYHELAEYCVNVINSQEIRKQMVALTPMGRLGSPEDIALAVLYLASPASSWVTGTTLRVSGGL